MSVSDEMCRSIRGRTGTFAFSILSPGLIAVAKIWADSGASAERHTQIDARQAPKRKEALYQFNFRFPEL
jgi:hypothetical protein